MNDAATPSLTQKTLITLKINHASRSAVDKSARSVTRISRLTGTKKGCDHRQCGACTILIDGKRTNSCLTLAIMKDGAEATTIEGIAQGNTLHPLQLAFIEHDASNGAAARPGRFVPRSVC
jgi:xanthine dehydrogenase YagT iron-sulfur-binding subunit